MLLSLLSCCILCGTYCGVPCMLLSPLSVVFPVVPPVVSLLLYPLLSPLSVVPPLWCLFCVVSPCVVSLLCCPPSLLWCLFYVVPPLWCPFCVVPPLSCGVSFVLSPPLVVSLLKRLSWAKTYPTSVKSEGQLTSQPLFQISKWWISLVYLTFSQSKSLSPVFACLTGH